MKGQRVNTLEELVYLAEERRSVLMPPRMSQRSWPAAVIINMQLIRVYHLLQEGIHIYIREPKAKKKIKQ
jgi:hypothetical protein